MKETSLIIILAMASPAIGGEIGGMSYSCAVGFSNINYMAVEIDSLGRGTCKFKFSNSDMVSVDVTLDSSFLAQIKSNFKLLYDAQLDTAGRAGCVDCAIRILSCNVNNQKYTIYRWGPAEELFYQVARGFQKIVNGEIVLYELKSSHTGGELQIPHIIEEFHRYFLDNSIYNFQTLRPLLEKWVVDSSISLYTRHQIEDCLPPEWNWNRLGLKLELIVPKPSYIVNEPITLSVRITNIGTKAVDLKNSVRNLFISIWPYTRRYDKSYAQPINIELPWAKSLKYKNHVLKPGKTIQVKLVNLNKKYRLPTEAYQLRALLPSSWVYEGQNFGNSSDYCISNFKPIEIINKKKKLNDSNPKFPSLPPVYP